ncbi:hypothetical protein GYMC10_1040 [Paenibacillus sp. Y412MC10]|nr:hypothetical protein GYMC10_1040 [Paenibacillus sp. Y412MC10]
MIFLQKHIEYRYPFYKFNNDQVLYNKSNHSVDLLIK